MTVQINNRYSDKDLQVFKNLILEKLEIAQEEFDFMNDQVRETNENSDGKRVSDWLEGTHAAEIEYLSMMAQRKQQYMKYLKNALIRISNKTYGVCSVTGELISKERLMLVPHATKSVNGKLIEQSKNRF